MITDNDRAKIVRGYTEALLWANEFDGRKVTKAGKAEIATIVEKFLDMPNVEEAFLNSEYFKKPDYFGHDLYLTRNRHGVGFWEEDHCNEEQGKLLTDAAHKLGESNEYVGSGGYVYVC